MATYAAWSGKKAPCGKRRTPFEISKTLRLFSEDFLPGHILADAVERHVIHHIEYVRGVHLAAAVYIGGCDLFLCQTAGISYGNICHVIHGVEMSVESTFPLLSRSPQV